VAGNARKELEIESGKKVVTTENFKELPESNVRSMKKISHDKE